jgi:ethanolamine transporter EutH
MAGDSALDSLVQVVPEMPPVGDLDRERRAFCCAFGVAAAAVPADHLHARVGVQPGPERLRGPLRSRRAA